MNLRTMFNQGLVRAFPHLQRRLEMANAYQAVFDGPQGQRVLRDILHAGGVLNVAYTEGDSGGTHFNDGKRALALHILDRLRWSEGELLQLGQEVTFEELTAREALQEQA
jgi:hypothetical protein